MTPTLIQQIKSARAVSVPLLAINTPDPAATIAAACDAINGETVKVQWDCVRGMSPAKIEDETSRSWIAEVATEPTEMNPVGALIIARKLDGGGVLFFHLASRFIGEPTVIQAIWNLRDQFKSNKRTLVLLGKQIEIPAELSDDVVVLDEPLPDEQQLSGIVQSVHDAAAAKLNDQTSEKAVEALRGLSAFAAEQVTAMSLRKTGLNLDSLWDRKRQVIEQTPGLKVYRGGETFDQIGGCDVVKDFLTRVMRGQARPNAVVFVDEIEKQMGGKGDLSGVSQDQLGTLLSYMQDHGCAGMIFLGPPGAAKSAIAKAAGNTGGVPTIQLDLGASKGSLVGQSEQQLRQALKVVTAVSNGRSLWIATCNSIADLPPELRRRFTLGTYFFDLPTEDERSVIWSIYAEKYGIEMFRHEGTADVDCVNPPPRDDGWTGAEIKQCCDIAWRLGCTLKEASGFIVPVSKSAADKLRALREMADGRFLSASYPGVYRKDAAGPSATESRPTESRRIELHD